MATVLLAFAFVFACFCASGVERFGRFHTGWAAIVFLIGSMLFGHLLPLFR